MNIDKLFNDLQKIRAEASKNKKYGFDEPLDKFIKIMSLLNPQSYGARMENYISQYLNLKRANNKNRGDIMNNKGDYWEQKVSIITSSNNLINIVQIRPWQDIKGYIIFTYNLLKNKCIMFYLSKNEMNTEIDLIGQSAHGSIEANINNTNKEFAIRLCYDENNIHFKRWIKQYSINIDNLKELIK